MPAAAALVVTEELALPLRVVGDLAAAVGVSREEVVILTQCASLGAAGFEGGARASTRAWIRRAGGGAPHGSRRGRHGGLDHQARGRDGRPRQRSANCTDMQGQAWRFQGHVPRGPSGTFS